MNIFGLNLSIKKLIRRHSSQDETRSTDENEANEIYSLPNLVHVMTLSSQRRVYMTSKLISIIREENSSINLIITYIIFYVLEHYSFASRQEDT